MVARSAQYDVGYGKPPKHTRFRPGQSENAKGRPKGPTNKRSGLHEERMKDLNLDEGYRDITIREERRSVINLMAQAVMRSLAVHAAKGKHRACGSCRSFWHRPKVPEIFSMQNIWTRR